jgi:hypothetical protein
VPDTINLDNYADLRDISRQFCGTLQSQAGGYLETVRQLFRPAAVFGAYLIGSHKDAPRDAAVAFGQFKTFYAEVAGSKPLSLDAAVPDALEIPFATPVLNPFTYLHEISTRTGPKTVTVTSPTQWVLSFPDFPLSRFRELAAAPKRSMDELRPFAINYAVLHFVVTRNPRLLGLFEALRFPINSEKIESLGDFPLLLLRSPAGSVLPPDDVIAQVCKYSGLDAIEEIIDREAWANMKDPIAEQFATIAESLQI